MRVTARYHPAKMRSLMKGIGNRGMFGLASRRAFVKNAIPQWWQPEKVALLYKKAALLGLTVDHVVPVSSGTVCGLHVWENLQLLRKTDNRRKGRCIWPDMPEN